MPHLEHNGASLYYELHGDTGEPVLFIQGVGVIGNGWRPQVDGLSSRFRTLFFDNRGIGQSRLTSRDRLTIEQMAGDARALIDAMGWETCHVVGHSMGGLIAQRLAIAHPERVRSLSLLCTVACGADAVRMSPRIFFLSLRMRIGTRAQRRRAFMELIYPGPFLETADVPALAGELAPLFGRDLADPPQLMFQQTMALRSHDCSSELHRLSIPTLVVSATFDPIAPPHFGRRLAELIPGARFVELKESSHGVVIQRAGEVNAMLERFVRSVDGGTWPEGFGGAEKAAG